MSHSLNDNKPVAIAAGFTETADWSIEGAGGAPIPLDAADVVGFILYDAGFDTILEIDDDNPSAAGSAVVITTRGDGDTNASGQVILDEDDTEELVGKYPFVMYYIDSADGDRQKIFKRGIIDFLKSALPG